MDAALADLIRQLDLERLEVNLFRGQSSDLGGKSVFGGQVIGQGLVAATRTVEGRIPHSLHAYFLLPGDMAASIVYEVDRVRDGRSFTARRVQAIQHGRPILSMMASFQVPEPGLDHQDRMPQVPPPESLPSSEESREQFIREAGVDIPDRVRESLLRPPAIDFRPVDPWNPLKPRVAEARQAYWFRAVDRMPDDPLLHTCMLTYASDYNLMPTALRPHAAGWFRGETILASIDHAMWFHRPARVDEWLLYSMDSPSAQGARGLARGLIFDRGGRLVASVAQEGLMRQATRPAP
jgi:acyl-CoA thioesterase-2